MGGQPRNGCRQQRQARRNHTAAVGESGRSMAQPAALLRIAPMASGGRHRRGMAEGSVTAAGAAPLVSDVPVPSQPMTSRSRSRALPISCVVAALMAMPTASASLAAQAAPVAMPAAFVPNLGQWPDAAAYHCTLGATTVFVTGDGWTARFADGEGGVGLAMRFIGAQTAAIVPEQRLAGVHHYFLGNEPGTWRTDVPRFAAVRYRGMYAGVDVLAYERGGVFEYDLVLAAGADLAAVAIDVAGADLLRLESDGSMGIAAAGRIVRQTAPVAFVVDGDGARVPVAAAFELRGERRFGFRAPGWDRSRPLVIDPGLVWSTFLGGTAAERLRAVAVDDFGRTTVAGETASPNFPVTPGAFDASHNQNNDVCVSRFDPSLTGTAQLTWSTFLGGFDNDVAEDVVVDGNGVVTLTGGSASPNFPVTTNARDTSLGGNFDAVVIRFDPNLAGSAQLRYSSFFGGSAYDFGKSVRVGANGQVTLFGGSQSTDLPTTAGAYDSTFNGSTDQYVARFDLALPAAQQLLVATYFGGSAFDPGGGDMALDANQRVVFVDQTASPDFPVTGNALLATYGGGLVDATVTVLDLALAGSQQLVYSSYLGGIASDFAKSIAIGGNGLVYVAGATSSADFPVTSGAFSTVWNGGQSTPDSDAFVTALDLNSPPAQQLVWSTFFGLTAYEQARRVVVDDAGVVTVTGLASLSPAGPVTTFPTTAGALVTSHTPARQGTFVSRLDPTRVGSAQLRHSTLVALVSDLVEDLALHDDGSVTVVGICAFAAYPTTSGAFQSTHTSGQQFDGVVTRLDLLPTGVTRYGNASPSCSGPPRIDVGSMPAVGNAAFEILGSGVPAGSPGLLALAGSGLGVPLPLLGIGVWVDPGVLLATPGVLADATGSIVFSLPLPAQAGIAGVRLDAQFVWLGPTAPPPCPPAGFAASPALTIVVQP